jgi:hypothetical protein
MFENTELLPGLANICRIDNPLLTFDDILADSTTGRTELEEYVYRFAEQGGLLHRLYMLSFAARLARDKGAAMRRYDEEITEPEKVLIRNEKDKASGFWKQAKFFKATSKLHFSDCWCRA